MNCKELLEVLHGTTFAVICKDGGGLIAKACVWNLNPESFEEWEVTEILMGCDGEYGLPSLEILVK